MFCTECGNQLNANSKFCPECGKGVDGAAAPGQPPGGAPQSFRQGSAAPAGPGRPPYSTQPRPGDQLAAGNWFGRYRKLAITCGIVLLVLAIGFFYSGSSSKDADLAYQQWTNDMGPLLQEYSRIEKDFYDVTKNPRVTFPDVINAFGRMAQQYQGLKDRVDKLQIPPKASKEDASDMAQIKKTWSDLLGVEAQITQKQQMINQQGDNKAMQEFEPILSQFNQLRMKTRQDIGQVMNKMASRHPNQQNQQAPSQQNPGTTPRSPLG